MFAVYAFCRTVDDIADGNLPSQEKLKALEAWRAEIQALYRGMPTHPISKALMRPVEQYLLQEDDFFAVIDGMKMDAPDSVRIRDSEELFTYCDKVACAVGRLSVRIFGLGDVPGKDLALNLGMALQLTNILRDIAEDAALDRIYLPADQLRHAGAAGNGVVDALTAPGFASVCDGFAERAEAYFLSAQHLMSGVEQSKVRPAMMMMAVYRRVLSRLRARGWQNLDQRVGPSKLGKVLIALRVGLFS